MKNRIKELKESVSFYIKLKKFLWRKSIIRNIIILFNLCVFGGFLYIISLFTNTEAFPVINFIKIVYITIGEFITLDFKFDRFLVLYFMLYLQAETMVTIIFNEKLEKHLLFKYIFILKKKCYEKKWLLRLLVF
jgi:hypothetical protein